MMFKKDKDATPELVKDEPAHPATKAAMTARGVAVALTATKKDEAGTFVVAVPVPSSDILARFAAFDGHGPLCQTRSMAQLPCGCGWAALVAGAKAVLA